MNDLITPASSAENGPRSRRQLFARLSRLVRKELLEVFRDRRTIVTLVVMPVLIYPLLALVFQRFLFTSLSNSGVYTLGIATELDMKILLSQFDAGQQVLVRRGDPMSKNPPVFHPVFLSPDNIRRSVNESSIHLGAIAKQHVGATSDRLGLAVPLSWELIYRSGSHTSEDAFRAVERRLAALNQSRIDAQLRQLGVSAVLPAAIVPDAVQYVGVPIFSLVALVPLILVLTTVTGAVYPAIDLTAGERERGTLEMLIAAPMPRLGLLLAKYVAVLVVALMTAVVNLVAMVITAKTTGLGPQVFGEGGLTLAVVLKVWLLLGLFAAFFSAVLLAITSYARSFKEAQAYIIPLMILCLVPGIISLLPSLEFSVPLAVTPLVNIVMLSREVLQGDVSTGLAAAAILSTAFYVVAAIALAARIFGTDAVLYGSPSTWSDIFRRPTTWGQSASLSAAVFTLALMFPIYFVLAGSLAQSPRFDLAQKLVMSALVTVLVFVAIPAAVASFHRVRLRDGLALYRARPTGLLAAALFGLVLWPFAYEVFLLNEWLGITSLTSRQLLPGQEFLGDLRRLSPPLVFFTLAVVPGVCEELFFRGFCFGAVRQVLSVRRTILATALLFGLFHVVAANVYTPERFLTSALLGLVLGWMRLQTSSVIPCMVVHALHNAVLLSIAYWQKELLQRGLGVANRTHLPLAWLLIAAVGTFVAAILLMYSNRRTEAQAGEASA